MKIFQQIKQSVYSPSYYRNVLESESLSSSFKYFFKYVLLLALLTSIIVSATTLPFLPSLFKGLVNNVVDRYPSELVITIDHGKASTNAIEPVLFPIDKDIKDNNKKSDLDNFLVIDTKNPFTIEHYDSYKTVLLLTADSFVSKDDGNQLRVFPLSNIKNQQIVTKDVVIALGQKVQKYTPVLIPLIIIGSFIVTFCVYTSYLFYIIFFALLILLLLYIMKIKMKYKKAYQIGLHAVTLIIFMDVLNFIPGVGIHVPFLATILGLLIVFLNFNNHGHTQAPNPTTS